MRRRSFLTLLGGAAAAWPKGAWAQERVRRIGVLMNLAAGDSAGQSFVAGFRQALQESGWVDGRNARIDMRWDGGDRERYRKYAAELAALAPDVIFAATTDAVVSVQQASSTVPIVFVGVIDPVGSGLITSMARPGGNATGFTIFEYAIAAKWLELLKFITLLGGAAAWPLAAQAQQPRRLPTIGILGRERTCRPGPMARRFCGAAA
jgi:putative ABC transport system substrate-binding protein